MKIKKIVSTFILLFFFSQIVAQKADSISMEDFEFLRDEKKIDIEFRFDNVVVGLFYSEEAYIKNHADKAESKNEGDGEKWEQIWQDSKKTLYPNRFIKAFNMWASELGLIIDTTAKDARFQLIVKTKMISPNMNYSSQGIAQTSNSVTLQYEFYDRENAVVVAKYTVPMVGTSDLTKMIGSRILGKEVIGIAIAYEEAGKKLGKDVYKKLKRKKRESK